MTNTGWFHRTGPDHRNGPLEWVPADAGNDHHPHQQELADHPQNLQMATNAAVQPGPYPVGEVKGRCPANLDDFIGVASFTVTRGGLTYRVFGTGEKGAGVVRFRQQDLGWDGRDIRTWLIIATATGIVATPDAAP